LHDVIHDEMPDGNRQVSVNRPRTARHRLAAANSPCPNRQRQLFGALSPAIFSLLIIGGLVRFSGAPAGASEVAEAPVIIDVRTAEEFAAGHLEGAINIPLDATDFREQVAELNQDDEFIVHCGTGARADRVVEFMAQQGFGSLGSHSLEEALDISGAIVIGDLAEAAALNPTTNENVSPGGPPMCALTGESLFGVTRN